MDPSIYLIAAVVVTIVLGIISYFFKDRVAAANQESQEREPAVRRRGPINRAELPAGARNRRTAVGRLQRARNAAEAEAAGSDEEGDLFDEIAQPEGKIGAKKMAKLEEKARKRADREEMEREREERKEREEQRAEERKREENREAQLEAEREAEEQRKREEQEKKDYEEYLAMKASFSVEEEGTDAQATQSDEDLMQKFIDYVMNNKVVIIEDMASHFGIKAQAVIDRIEHFMEDGTLTGVLDDRGKFIYITNDELTAIAKFIKQRGRVSIQELAESSNQLVRTKPLQAEEITA